MEWYDVPATDLDARQLHDILALRAQVFVVEQQCAYLDVDGLDLLPTTRHLWATDLAAYARLLGPTPDDADGAAHIGRVIVSPTARGTGLGHTLIERAVASCRSTWPEARIVLSAQAHLSGFYGSHGFVTTSEPYDEDGIPHIDMELR